MIRRHLTHPNLVPLIGVTLYPLQIVSEWMPGGDLSVYVKLNSQASRITLVSPSFYPSSLRNAA